MKVSILIPYYGNRRFQLERSIPFLENQTYPDYELVLMDDGKSDLPDDLIGKFDRYIQLRVGDVPIRSPNVALRTGFAESDGDFIITSQPELLIPYDAVERMVAEANMNRRNVATQYHLTKKRFQDN